MWFFGNKKKEETKQGIGIEKFKTYQGDVIRVDFLIDGIITTSPSVQMQDEQASINKLQPIYRQAGITTVEGRFEYRHTAPPGEQALLRVTKLQGPITIPEIEDLELIATAQGPLHATIPGWGTLTATGTLDLIVRTPYPVLAYTPLGKDFISYDGYEHICKENVRIGDQTFTAERYEPDNLNEKHTIKIYTQASIRLKHIPQTTRVKQAQQL